VVPGDEIVTAIAPAAVGEGGTDEELAAMDGVALASPIATFDLAFRGTRLEAVAVRGADLAADGRLSFSAGDRAAAFAALDAGGAVVVPRSRAERLGVGLGDVLAVATAGGLVELEVAGVIERSFPGRGGEAVLVGWSDALDRFGVAGADAFAIRYAEAPAGADARAAVRAFAAERAFRTVAPLSSVEGALGDALDGVFGLLDALAWRPSSSPPWASSHAVHGHLGARPGARHAACRGHEPRQVWRSVLVEAGILGVIGGWRVAGRGRARRPAGDHRRRAGSTPGSTCRGRRSLRHRARRLPAMLAAAQPARIAGARSIVSAVRGE